jgi:nitrate reductase gamma subunit
MSLAAYLLGAAAVVLTLIATIIVWLRRKYDRIYNGLE